MPHFKALIKDMGIKITEKLYSHNRERRLLTFSVQFWFYKEGIIIVIFSGTKVTLQRTVNCSKVRLRLSLKDRFSSTKAVCIGPTCLGFLKFMNYMTLTIIYLF